MAHESALDRTDAWPPPAPAPLAVAAGPRVLPSDIAAALAAYTLLLFGVWAIHGGASDLTANWHQGWTSITRISGLLASGAGLLGLVLVARPRPIERRYGLDRLFIWHRYLSEAMALALGVHVAAGVVAWSDGGYTSAVADLTGRAPYMAGATVGALLIGVITVLSLRSMRRRISYEAWYFVHLTAYLAFAISFSHEIVVGTDLATDTLARWAWIGLHVAVAVALLWGRWGTLARAATRPLRVASVVPQSHDTVSLTLNGPDLADLPADAGQWFLLRPLRRGLWWQGHPFSLSAAPSTFGLRFTVKDRGDATASMARLPVGTRVIVEGPYGVTTPSALGHDKIVFIAGGVGVAHVRSLLERLDQRSEPVVLYRARDRGDLVHLEELQALCRGRGGRVLVLLGRTSVLAGRDPFAADALRQAVPDLRQRTAIACGPESLVQAARRGLIDAGVPSDRIHFEQPWW